jgi:hypothetical protein
MQTTEVADDSSVEFVEKDEEMEILLIELQAKLWNELNLRPKRRVENLASVAICIFSYIIGPALAAFFWVWVVKSIFFWD